MKPLILCKTTIPQLLIALTCFGLSPNSRATDTDGALPNGNNADGVGVLTNLTTGAWNSGFGFEALNHNTIGSLNTATGLRALFNNTEGNANTANGMMALFSNTTGTNNVAVGAQALVFNDTGVQNTAVGTQALSSNTIGERNTAIGFQALANGTGNFNFANTAVGQSALFSNTSGEANTATGAAALFNNIDGDFNTAVGLGALGGHTSGNNNIAIGTGAGQNLTIGFHNIDIGNTGVAGESNKIRIGTVGTQDGTFIAGIDGIAVTGAAVLVNGFGQLGVMASSQRFKDEIKSMDKASEGILALKPVTFRYKREVDPAAMPQFGLVAEEVDKVNPDLVARDAEGKPYSVRYDAVNAMLLNEFLKEHRKVEKLEAKLAEQDKKIEALTSGLQRVSAQIEVNKTAPQIVLSNQ